MGQVKSVTSVLFSKLIGFLIFILLIGLLNILVPYVNNVTFSAVITFLNKNIWILILFSLLIAGGELFSVLIFPFNLPYPLFNAVGSIFLIKFLFNIILFVNSQLVSLSFPGIGITLKELFVVISAIVFLIVLISGYVKLLVEMYSDKQEERQEAREDYEEKRKYYAEKRVKKPRKEK